jgi:hypothetical protein
LSLRSYPERRSKDHPRFPLKNAFEDAINDQIAEIEPPVYEQFKIPYTITSCYLPDFVLSNGIIIEVKGYFDQEDRAKLLAVKKQHPDLDIRLVFSNPSQRISKRAKTTVGQWAETHGFKYSKSRIPAHWFTEATNNKGTLEEFKK